MGSEKRTLKTYSKAYKLQAVRRVLEDGRGVRETAREFQVNHGMVQKWIKRYLEKGEDGLQDTRALKLCEGDLPAPLKKSTKKPNAKGLSNPNCLRLYAMNCGICAWRMPT